MAIVKMKHLRLIAADSEREALIRDLSKAGCVEITQPNETLPEKHAALLTRNDSDSGTLRSKHSLINSALEIANK